MRRPGGEPPRAGRPGGQASRSTATGPHHGAMRRDGARWRRRGRGAIIKRRWTLRGQTPRPARLWGAHGDAPSKTLSVCYLPCHAPRRWRGGAMGTSRPTATGPHHGAREYRGMQSRAPRRGAAARWGHRALPQRDRTTGVGDAARRWDTARGACGNGARGGEWRGGVAVIVGEGVTRHAGRGWMMRRGNF